MPSVIQLPARMFGSFRRAFLGRLDRVILSWMAGVMIILSGAGDLRADVTLPAIFGDHMVLQQDATLPVWGKADPGEKVSVAIGEKSASTVADAQGRWRVDLPKMVWSDKPATVTIAGKNTVKFEDVLIGDVWICSGQSNMEFGVAGSVGGKEAIDKADLPNLRLFLVVKGASLSVQEEIGRPASENKLACHWQVCTPKSLAADGNWGGFSAVGFFFAREIQQSTGRPLGLIGSYWGGTTCQAWTSLSGLESEPRLANYLRPLSDREKSIFPIVWADYIDASSQWWKEVGMPWQASEKKWREESEKAKATSQPAPPRPEPSRPKPNVGNPGTRTVLYNAMINPLIPYAIKGVVWYQGESNAYNGTEYGILFPNMIKDWRNKWGQGDFSFIFVQIAGYGPGATDPTRGTWAWLREGQSRALALPKTGMAVAIDVGNAKDIHPHDKWSVGHRLALAARHVAYGQELVCSGPTFDSMKPEAGKLRLSFKNIGAGLTTGTTESAVFKPDTSELIGFSVAGEDGKFVAAKATIEGDTIVVGDPGVSSSVMVRYGWADFSGCNLYNKDGLPAVPFRTDDRKP